MDLTIKDIVIKLHIDKQSRKSAFREVRLRKERGKGCNDHKLLFINSLRREVRESETMRAVLMCIPPTLKESSGVGNESSSNTCYLKLQLP